MNLDGNYSAFKSLVEKYLKPEILAEPSVSNSSGPINRQLMIILLLKWKRVGSSLIINGF